MVDMHTHIMFGVDDGPKELADTIELLKEAETEGITDIILTPHYLEGYYIASVQEIMQKYYFLKKKIHENNIKLNIYMGNEIYITPNVTEKIINKEVLPLNNSKYILIETEMSVKSLCLRREIQKILNAGLIPILAHPERYEFVQKDRNALKTFISKGLLLQGNYGSVIGYYGADAQKEIKSLLRRRLISFMATDAHRPNSIYMYLPKIKKKLKKMVPLEYYLDITENNIRKIIPVE